ncbi:MAG: hypothetical protein ACAH88_04410 [Roseimicrobium sp.]
MQPAAAFLSAACCASYRGEVAYPLPETSHYGRSSPSPQQAADSAKRQQAARSPRRFAQGGTLKEQARGRVPVTISP